MAHSWNEVQALAVRAAAGAGVPAAQALAFGAMAARHLADAGAAQPLARALKTPDKITSLAQRVEEMIEQASVVDRPVATTEADDALRALLVSWLTALPCETEVAVRGPSVAARIKLTAPSTKGRPDRVMLPPDLAAQMQRLAEKTYVPDSAESRTIGAGAGLMDLD